MTDYDNLAHYADIEAKLWPSIYLPESWLSEAIWYALNYQRGDVTWPLGTGKRAGLPEARFDSATLRHSGSD